MKDTINILTNKTYSISATHYYNPNNCSKDLLIYLHGGGLIFGEREDLPETYLELLTQSGYSILALDYLLAPESKIDDICQTLIETIHWYTKEGFHTFQREEPNFYLFGRSAGAYLAFYLSTIINPKFLKGIISFYGYYTLQDPYFTFPNPHFQQTQKVSSQIVDSLIQDTPVTKGTANERYLIYLYARQEGKWLDFLTQNTSQASHYSLEKKQIENLPPTFLVHCNNDPDVPARQSKYLSNTANKSHFIELEGDVHDFDRLDIAKGTTIYQELLKWLAGK